MEEISRLRFRIPALRPRFTANLGASQQRPAGFIGPGISGDAWAGSFCVFPCFLSSSCMRWAVGSFLVVTYAILMQLGAFVREQGAARRCKFTVTAVIVRSIKNPVLFRFLTAKSGTPIRDHQIGFFEERPT